MKRWIALGVIMVSMSGWSIVWADPDGQAEQKHQTAQLESLQTLPAAIDAIATPKTPQPQWYKDQVAAEQAAARAATRASSQGASGRVITYTIGTKGATRSNLAEFAAQADQTLNDGRGWAQLGLTFKQVPSGGDPGGYSAGKASQYARMVGYRDATGAGGTFDYAITGSFEDWTYSKAGIPSLVVELGSYTYHDFSHHKAAMWAMLD